VPIFIMHENMHIYRPFCLS